jgi:hypothetical protein
MPSSSRTLATRREHHDNRMVRLRASRRPGLRRPVWTTSERAAAREQLPPRSCIRTKQQSRRGYRLPCNAAARADCSSSSNSAASGCAKRCARTAPLPRSRRLSSRMPGSAREQERCLGRGSAYGIGGPAVSPRATSAAITPRRVAHGRRDRPDPVAVLAVPARVAPRPRGRRLLLEHARVGDRARRRRRRWRAARRTRYVGSEGPAHRVRDLPRVGRN